MKVRAEGRPRTQNFYNTLQAVLTSSRLLIIVVCGLLIAAASLVAEHRL